MNKEFVCTIDQAKFSSEEALVNHLLKHYSLKQNEGDKTSDILKSLKDAFPTSRIEVTNSLYRGKESTHVTLAFPELNSDFDFRIGKTDEDDYYGDIFYDCVEDAVSRYQFLLRTKDELIHAIEEKYGIKDISISQIHETGAFSDSNDSISFSFEVDGREIFHRYEFQGIENCLRSLDAYFVNSVEGICFVDYSRYDSANTVFVDGVDIKQLANRAEILRVEIVKLKQAN